MTIRDLVQEWLRARTIKAEAEARDRDLRAWKDAVLEIDGRAEYLATEHKQENGEVWRVLKLALHRREFSRLLSAIMAARPATLSEAEALDVAERVTEELGRLRG